MLVAGCSVIADFSEFETREDRDGGSIADASAEDAEVPLNDAGPGLDAGSADPERCNRVDDDGDGGIDEGLMEVGSVTMLASNCGDPARIRVASGGGSYAVAFVDISGMLRVVSRTGAGAGEGPMGTGLSALSGYDDTYWLAYQLESGASPAHFFRIGTAPAEIGIGTFGSLDVAALSATEAWAGAVGNDGSVPLYHLGPAGPALVTTPAIGARAVALARRTTADVEVAYAGTFIETEGVFHFTPGGAAPVEIATGSFDRVLVDVLDDSVLVVYGPTPMGDTLHAAGAIATRYGVAREARALTNDETTAAVLVTEPAVGLVFRVALDAVGAHMDLPIELEPDVEWRDLAGIANDAPLRFVAAGKRGPELVVQEIRCTDPP